MERPWIPIIIAVVVSTIGAFVLQDLIGFWPGFGAVTLLQIIVGSATNQMARVKTSLEMENQLTQRIKDAAKQTLKLKCPCTNMVEQIVPIRMDEPNFYKCLNCEKNISVNLQATTALMTEIINIDATHSQVVKNMEEVLREEMYDDK
jgi:7-keto-8-aminopelargonate synthetase-like enzyme